MAKFTSLKKGDTVILHMFTGIAVGVKEITHADKNTVGFETRAGLAKFSRKTGKQVDPPAKAERFANYITEDDGSFVPPAPKKAAKKSSVTVKKPIKTKKPEPEEPFDEDDYEEEEPTPKKPAKKSTAKKKAAKKQPEPEDEEEDDDDEEDN